MCIAARRRIATEQTRESDETYCKCMHLGCRIVDVVDCIVLPPSCRQQTP
jgi:hypothetical protein